MEKKDIHKLLNGAALPNWAILPMRLFLGVSFLAAGFDKLADPSYLDPSARDYIGQQIARFAPGTPLEGFSMNFAAPNATLFGVLTMGGELCIGLAVLLGLLTRFSAGMGLLLNLTFFLSATWDVHPFYFGADLPYVVGWLTLLLAGPGPLALDALVKSRLLAESAPTMGFARQGSNQGARRDTGQSARQTVSVPFSAETNSLTRRAFLGASAAGLVAAVMAATGLSWGVLHKEKASALVPPAGPTPTTAPPPPVAAIPTPEAPPTDTPAVADAPNGASGTETPTQAPANTPSPQPTDTPPPPATAQAANNPPATAQPDNTPTAQADTKPPNGQLLAKAGAVPVGQSMQFSLSNGDPGVLVHNDAGYSAYVAVCTHQGCVVRARGADVLVCPCHGAQFDAKAGGQVLRGPARRPLSSIPLQVASNGDVYVIG